MPVICQKDNKDRLFIVNEDLNITFIDPINLSISTYYDIGGMMNGSDPQA